MAIITIDDDDTHLPRRQAAMCNMDSTKATARFAGLLYLLSGAPGVFSYLYVPAVFVVPGDAAALTTPAIRTLPIVLVFAAMFYRLWRVRTRRPRRSFRLSGSRTPSDIASPDCSAPRPDSRQRAPRDRNCRSGEAAPLLAG
jgi:hypothetical protein